LNQLGLFAKFWQPGTVKTRLAATIGDDAACNLYRSFLSHLLSQLKTTADQRMVVFSPRHRETEFKQAVSSNWKTVPQSEGDLGTRMKTFFQERFSIADSDSPAIDSKVVVIGADCPHLKPSEIEKAFQELDNASVVLGPSTDGGYYLIGMRHRCFDVFEEIEWSTDSVLERTIGHLETQKVAYHTLAPLTDVDELESLIGLESYLTARETGHAEGESTMLLESIRNAIRSGPSGQSKATKL